MKTIQELEAMTDDELRVMLAELVGFDMQYAGHGKDGLYAPVRLEGYTHDQLRKSGVREVVPDYPKDLNGCAAVEGSLPHTKLYDYDLHLRMANASSARTSDFEAHLDDYAWSRTARQRTIALIATLQPQ